MGTDQGIYPWVGTLVMGNLMGRRFWVGRGCFFLGGRGGKRKSQGTDDTRFQTDPFCYILYVKQWGFRYSMSSGHREGGPRSSIALGRTYVVQVSTTRRPSPHIEDGKGTATPRSTTDSTEQWV